MIKRFLTLVLCSASAAFAGVLVFISDSNSWESSGGFTTHDGKGEGGLSGGARRRTAEIIKTFGQRCPAVAVTFDRSKAQFIVLLDHEGGKGVGLKDNKIAVFNANGDAIYSGSRRSLGNAVKDGCAAIMRASAR
jgi:hypothetical protein